MVTERQTRLQRFIEVLRRANQVATSTELDTLLYQMLDLFIAVTQSHAGIVALYDETSDEFIVKAVKGNFVSQYLLEKRLPADQGLMAYVLHQDCPVFFSDVEHDPQWDRAISAAYNGQLHSAYCLPLILHDQLVGMLQVFNLSALAVDDPDEAALVQLLSQRLVTELEKARQLEEAQRRERRQRALVDTIADITTILEPDQILECIMNRASNLLEIEATSIWLRDEHTGDLVLQMATGHRSEHLSQLRVPAGKGIIGYVASTGERVLVNDVRKDSRFYSQIDKQSGFVTRSILCVPLRARKIQVGGERGDIEESIIGGAQALNKRNGQPFTAEDVRLFETLASQAATVLQLSRLYDKNSRLFLGIIRAVTSAIDLKDPYTRGHSQRVSDFSVSIAREMELSQEMIYHVRIGGILHDVGKIGVSDRILQKPNHLTDSEMEEMKRHPTNGVRLLEDAELIELLHEETPALAQHHERLDGRGYPLGLQGDQITLIGRIVAVADAFDAMTSDRPYRPGMPVDRALRILCDAAGTEYDAACVEALMRAREHGLIQVQHERENRDVPTRMG